MTSTYYASTKKPANADEARNTKIAALYQQGVERDALSERFGVTKSRVSNILRSKGICAK